ncbi:MAG TPA: hypothetical protein VIK93_11380 [Limnochordales bacterium]
MHFAERFVEVPWVHAAGQAATRFIACWPELGPAQGWEPLCGF